MRMRQVRCFDCLPANDAGRDFVVGDLHGQRAAFEGLLDRVGFDAQVDRVISVGDLINRGPHSLDTLALIEEPWFHAVLGNHELLMLHYLGLFQSRLHHRQAFAVRKGAWLVEAASTNRRRVMQLAEHVATLPLVIRVEGLSPFQVMHGDLQPLGERHDRVLRSESIDVHVAERLTMSRGHLGEVLAAELCALEFGSHQVCVSSSPKGRLPLTYVGHSPMPRITVHNSYVYVDQGVQSSSTRTAHGFGPTLLEHRGFSLWLDGVAAAHRSLASTLVRPRRMRWAA